MYLPPKNEPSEDFGLPESLEQPELINYMEEEEPAPFPFPREQQDKSGVQGELLDRVSDEIEEEIVSWPELGKPEFMFRAAGTIEEDRFSWPFLSKPEEEAKELPY